MHGCLLCDSTHACRGGWCNAACTIYRLIDLSQPRHICSILDALGEPLCIYASRCFLYTHTITMWQETNLYKLLFLELHGETPPYTWNLTVGVQLGTTEWQKVSPLLQKYAWPYIEVLVPTEHKQDVPGVPLWGRWPNCCGLPCMTNLPVNTHRTQVTLCSPLQLLDCDVHSHCREHWNACGATLVPAPHAWFAVKWTNINIRTWSGVIFVHFFPAWICSMLLCMLWSKYI